MFTPHLKAASRINPPVLFADFLLNAGIPIDLRIGKKNKKLQVPALGVEIRRLNRFLDGSFQTEMGLL